MGSIPLQRCLDKARSEGYLVGIVERFIPFPKPHGHRVDLFGLFDAVAVRYNAQGVLGIQACRDGDIPDHFQKTKEPEQAAALQIWKAAGNRAVIWGWALKRPRDANGKLLKTKEGKSKPHKWIVREVEL